MNIIIEKASPGDASNILEYLKEENAKCSEN